MATRTSTQTGNWADTSTWGGSAAPGDGDIAIITSGHTVTVAANATVGSNSANVGDAVEIRATDSTTFGKLIVNDGVTLTLKGNDDTSNTAMEIDRYAVFEPQPGATIAVETAAQYETVIANAGIINAIGTLAKPITFTASGSGINWNNSATGEVKSGTGWYYDGENNIAVRALTNPWVGNSGGTALGSSGSSSVSFSSKTPAGICATEVATLADVNGVGKYYINYHTGVVYFYHVFTDGNPSFTAAYKYLSFNGWGIQSLQDQTYNEAKFEYCNFQYLGGTSARNYGLDNRYKYSATAAANRLFKLVNCTVSYCRQFCAMREFTGTSGDEIKITGNTFNHCYEGAFGAALMLNESAACSYIDIENNVLNCQQFFSIGRPYETATTHTAISVSSNTGACSGFVTSDHYVSLPNGMIEDNNILGFGQVLDSRMMDAIGGAAGNHLIIQDNTFSRGNRWFSGAYRYTTIRRNIIDSFPHHWITSSTPDDIYCPEVYIENNLFWSRHLTDSGTLETGYNHRHHLHDWRFVNNTLGRGMRSILSIGDTSDYGTYSLTTGLVVANNLAYQPKYGIERRAFDSTVYNQVQPLVLDYNLVYNPGTAAVLNYNKQATFVKSATAYNLDGTRNVLGVALFDPLYTLPEATTRSLVFTYTSATNQTLAWGGGTAVQLVVSSGTATAGANATFNGTLTDSGKSWSTDMTTGTIVRCKWVKVTGGTGSGQIRGITNNTATVLTVVPAWTTTPDATSTYAIIESEAKLFDSGASNYVRAGIYLPSLPTSTQTDTNITITASNLTSNPLLATPTANTAAGHELTTGSPAIGAAYATYAPATDYYGTTRITPDIGAFEFPDNAPPVANAGIDQTITLPTNSVVLDGTGSTDSDGTIVSFSWAYVSGPTTPFIDDSETDTASVENLVAGIYVFRLTVTDDDGSTDTDDVTVTVNPAPLTTSERGMIRSPINTIIKPTITGVC
jgi:hypothetical protein